MGRWVVFRIPHPARKLFPLPPGEGAAKRRVRDPEDYPPTHWPTHLL